MQSQEQAPDVRRMALDWIDGVSIMVTMAVVVGAMRLLGVEEVILSEAATAGLVFAVPLARRKLFKMPVTTLRRRASALGSLAAILTILGLLSAVLATPLFIGMAREEPYVTAKDVAWAREKVARASKSDLEDAQKDLAWREKEAAEWGPRRASRLVLVGSFAAGGALAFALGCLLDAWLTRREQPVPAKTEP